jgi:hypothetical protein
MSMRSIPVDAGRMDGARVAVAPVPYADFTTGEVRTDRRTGEEIYNVGVFARVQAGERDSVDACVITVQVLGRPEGLVEDLPVTVIGLTATPWDRDGRSGITFRADRIVAAAARGGGAAAAAAGSAGKAAGS